VQTATVRYPGTHVRMEGIAAAQPELLAEHLLPHLSGASIAALALTSRACATVATADSFWRRQLESGGSHHRRRAGSAEGWKLAPLPISGVELCARWVARAGGFRDLSNYTVRRLKAELKARGVPIAGLAEKQELRDALARSRGADLPASYDRGGFAGEWQQIYRGVVGIEALRRYHVHQRPMQGPMGRLFVGSNASWDTGWTKRWIQVDQDTFSVAEDEEFSRVLAEVHLTQVSAG
jgi:hypothetical protein